MKFSYHVHSYIPPPTLIPYLLTHCFSFSPLPCYFPLCVSVLGSVGLSVHLSVRLCIGPQWVATAAILPC